MSHPDESQPEPSHHFKSLKDVVHFLHAMSDDVEGMAATVMCHETELHHQEQDIVQRAMVGLIDRLIRRI